MMKPCHIAILLSLLLLAACSPAPIADTPIPTSLPPTVPPTEALPAKTPTPTETAVPRLSAQSTFEVIAAIHACVLIIEEYAAQDLSPAERQAVLAPLVEFGILPLGYFFDQSNPDPQLAGEWDTAAEIYRAFLPSTLDLDAEDTLQSLLDQIGPASGEMIESAAAIAEDLGVDTSQYGEDYAGAIQAASALLPELAIQPLPESPARGELNPALFLIQLTPFVFDFAGSPVFYTIGTIQNTSAAPQTNVTIEVAYYNFLDEHIGTVRGRLLADVANLGGVYPFIATDVIAGEEAALLDQTRYEVSVFSTPARAESNQAFEISLHSIQEVSGEYHLTCQITPTGDQAATPLRLNIGVAAYDANNTLVGVGGGTYPVEDTMLVDLVIQVLSGEPASFEFSAEVIEE